MADEIRSDQPEKPRKSWRWLGFFLVISGLILLVGALGSGYYLLHRNHQLLAKRVVTTRKQVETLQNQVVGLQQTTHIIQQNLTKTLSLTAEQEKVMQDWRAAQQGDLMAWRVAEAQYLVKLANDFLQLMQNSEMAKVLIERADHILQEQNNPQFLELRQALAENLTQINAAPAIDVTGIFATLKALDQQVEQLPLPAMPIAAPLDAAKPKLDDHLPWWQAAFNQTWHALQRVVVIRKINGQAPPLVLPEEKKYYYQNLHAQMTSAVWGLLHRNDVVYQASLQQAIDWGGIYFDQNAMSTQNFIATLQKLRQINISPPKIDLAQTLQRFDHFFDTTNLPSRIS